MPHATLFCKRKGEPANKFFNLAAEPKKKQQQTEMAEQRFDPNKSYPEKDVKAPNLIERAKEEIDALVHNKKSPRHHKEASGISHHSKKSAPHHKETHGLSEDIDEDTPIDEVKGPGVFERVKEEFEALVEAIHPKK